MENLKEKVKEKYDRIALQNQNSSLPLSCNLQDDYSNISEDYATSDGYENDADLGLGCGLPVSLAKIKEGDTVIDLGCGAGNDCFVARQETGPSGKVIGLDFADAMLEMANRNRDKLNFENIEFIKGDIESMPIDDGIADIVASNCVLNLVPDKEKAFSEIHRVLKTGGHFSISDIVVEGEITPALQSDAEEYAGCVSGAIQLDHYLNIVEAAGFSGIQIQKKRGIKIPEDTLLKHLDKQQLHEFNQTFGIFSVSLFAKK